MSGGEAPELQILTVLKFQHRRVPGIRLDTGGIHTGALDGQTVHAGDHQLIAVVYALPPAVFVAGVQILAGIQLKKSLRQSNHRTGGDGVRQLPDRIHGHIPCRLRGGRLGVDGRQSLDRATAGGTAGKQTRCQKTGEQRFPV